MTAFCAKLNEFAQAESLAVAWENVQFEPKEDEPYLRPFLLPATTQAAALGQDAENLHVGIYQIDVLSPAGTGWGDCANLAGKIQRHFKRGTRMEDCILIKHASFGPGMKENERYKIPVSIGYRAWLPNE